MQISTISQLSAGIHTPAEAPLPRPVPEDQRTLIHAIHAANAAQLFGQDNELTFVFDRDTKRAIVRMVNRETHEIVDQIPEEYVLRLAEQLKTPD